MIATRKGAAKRFDSSMQLFMTPNRLTHIFMFTKLLFLCKFLFTITTFITWLLSNLFLKMFTHMTIEIVLTLKSNTNL